MPAGMFIIFIMVLLMILFAVIMVIVAFLVMNKNRKEQEAMPEYFVRAEVLKTDSNTRRMSNAGRKYSYDHTQYFVEFLDHNNNRIVLNCKKHTYESLLPGFYGDLTYKGNQLISFVRLPEHEERRLERKLEDGYFFTKKTNKTNPIDFYCDAPKLNIKIPAEAPEKLDVDEVLRYINHMLENDTENFFGLDNGKMVIQFFNEGNSDEILIDIPSMKENGSYQAIINGINKTKQIVKAYYNGDDVFELADFDLMKF